MAWKKWKYAPDAQTVVGLAGKPKFQSANLGILPGLSGVTVVDVDTPLQIDEAIHRFGPTPLMVETPSGGRHLYYRGQGERCRNLRPFGLEIDIKGVGGFVVVPPSRRPDAGPDAPAYRFITGDWTEIGSLPVIRPDALEFMPPSTDRSRGRLAQTIGNGKLIGEGERNDRLFRWALRIATGCESEDELIAELHALNIISCSPPLEESEVLRIAKSAWNYEARGANFTKGGGFSCSNRLAEVIGDASSFWLFKWLKQVHFNKLETGEAFAVCPRGMASSVSNGGLGERSIRRAREHLVAIGILVRVSPGGCGVGDPARFQFGRLDRIG